MNLRAAKQAVRQRVRHRLRSTRIYNNPKLCFYKQHELWHSKKGKISTPVRILFDTGSQRTYVTENLRSKLKSVQHERLNLNTFGEARYKSQNCDFVHLRLKRPGSGNDETIDISALTFPGICSPLP